MELQEIINSFVDNMPESAHKSLFLSLPLHAQVSMLISFFTDQRDLKMVALLQLAYLLEVTKDE